MRTCAWLALAPIFTAACAAPFETGPTAQPRAVQPPVAAAAPAPVVAQPSARGTAWTMMGLFPSLDGADPFPGFQIPPWLLPQPQGKQGNPQQWQVPIPWQAIPLPPGWGVPQQPKPQPQPPARPPTPQAQPQPNNWSIPGWTVPVQPTLPAGDWPAAWAQLEAEVLAETNARRARGATCGTQSFPPAGPLAPNAALQKAARGHSKDMATRNYFNHQTPEGVAPDQRSRAAGFTGSFTGENIAAGDRTAAAVVNGWMNSPGHCVNIMEARYKSLGVGYAEGSGSYRTYWTQNFGN